MKLKGILSSHSRRQVWERNNAPVSLQPAPKLEHDPQPQPDGTVRCCGSLYAKHAHAAHLRGERIELVCSGIRMTAEDDAEAYAAFAATRPDPILKIWRAELEAQAEAERGGRAAKIADGVEPNPWGW